MTLVGDAYTPDSGSPSAQDGQDGVGEREGEDGGVSGRAERNEGEGLPAVLFSCCAGLVPSDM